MKFIEIHLESFLLSLGFSSFSAHYLRLSILFILLIFLAWILFWLTKRLVIPVFYKLFKKTSFKWDDILAERDALRNLSHLTPAIVIKMGVPLLFNDFPAYLSAINKLTDAYLIVAGTLVLTAVLTSIEILAANSRAFREKPVASYFQLLRIVIYIVSFILVLSVLLGKTPVYFLSVFGAMSAVLLLIFKDTILGLVSSLQMSSNDTVRVGDWIEMPKFDADGVVIAINWNTVKVRNWDKTVTTIPTYYFTSDSFKNWRGMQESGGRRIKRSINIDVKSIKFVDQEAKERYKNSYYLKEYMEARQKIIEDFNKENKLDDSIVVDARRMTNLGTFRHYVESYLKKHRGINQNMTVMVRQLPMDGKGIPIEIYCFTSTIAWIEYEDIQSDIFDHLLAVASFFELEVFQEVSGSDIRNLK